MATFDLNDDQVVVIIGTGAGGGVLANELAQKGVKVVALEAGGRYLPEDYINDEWESFGQLAWLDARTTSGSWRLFCAWSCAAVHAPWPRVTIRGADITRVACTWQSGQAIGSEAAPSDRRASKRPCSAHSYSYIATAHLPWATRAR